MNRLEDEPTLDNPPPDFYRDDQLWLDDGLDDIALREYGDNAEDEW